MSEIIEVEEINVKLQPAVISVVEQEKFQQYINQVVKEYSGHIASAESLKDDIKTRTTLRKLKDQLETQRKTIKKDINAPYTTFETWYKKAIDPVNNIIDTLDKTIKDVEAEQKEIKKGIVRAELKAMTDETDIDPRLFENMVDDWAKPANFTPAMKLKKATLDSINYVIEQERSKQEEAKKNKQTVSNFAFNNDIGETPYLRMLDEGRSVTDILGIMTEDITKQREREKARAEQQAKAEQERKELATQQLEKDFGVVDTEPEPEPELEPEPVIEQSKEPKKIYRAVVQIEVDFETYEDKNIWKSEIENSKRGKFRAFNAIKFDHIEVQDD